MIIRIVYFLCILGNLLYGLDCLFDIDVIHRLSLFYPVVSSLLQLVFCLSAIACFSLFRK